MLKTILYTSPFVPAEWIAAHGMRPCRILPDSIKAAGSVGAGVCPYAQAFIEAVCSDKEMEAVVLTTTCDQMRRASELITRSCDRPVFLMNVPATWQTSAAQDLYQSELRRLGAFLVRLGGATQTHDTLTCVMSEYDRARAALREARTRVSARGYAEAVAAFGKAGQPRYARCDQSAARQSAGPGAACVTPRGVPLALVGGALLACHFGLFDLIEQGGGTVVLDATASGERTVPAPFDPEGLARDPMEALAGAYFGSIPDAFRRPNAALYQWLQHKMAERGVRGILFHRYTWCDVWHGEAQRMKEWADLPFLVIDIGDDGKLDRRTATQIQAILETLQ